MPAIYTDKLLMILPPIFSAKTAFQGALAKVQVVDGITENTLAFKVKRSGTPVVINKYDVDSDLNDGNSRFGKINEVKYGDIDVPYDEPYAINEAIDKFTVNADEQQVVADRLDLTSQAITRQNNSNVGKLLSNSAGRVLELSDLTPEKVSALFDDASAHYTDYEVDGNLYAFVSPTLFNAIMSMIQFKSLSGAVVDVNNNKLINYKGFTISKEATRYFNEKDVAYFTPEGIVIPFVGIEFSRTMDDSRIAGQLLQSAGKGGRYLQEENKIAVIKATYDGNINPANIELDKATAQVKVGATNKVTATVLPESAADKSVTFTSSDETVATVSADGTITGVKEGTATVTAKTSNGLEATVKVTVNAAS